MLEDEANDNPQRWIQIIKTTQESDNETRDKANNKPEKYHTRDDIVRSGSGADERIVIPKKLEWELLNSVHKFLLHFGMDKVIGFAKKCFEIKNLERLTRDVVASYNTCIATKYYTRPTRGPEYYELPNDKDQTISLDIFGPLPKTRKNNKYIIVTMDQFSKLVKCFPVKNQKLQTIIDTLECKYFNTMRVPNTFVTDNGGQFLTDEWRDMRDEPVSR